AKVLAHPVDRKAEIVFALVHGAGTVLHLPGTRCPLGDYRDQLFDIETSLLAEMDAFRQSLNKAGNTDLVDHLCKLARADRAHEADHARISIDYWPDALKNSFRRSNHDRQHTVFGTCLPAGDRRIDEV